MKEYLPFILTALGTGGGFAFIEFLIKRSDKKKENEKNDQFDVINKKLDAKEQELQDQLTAINKKLDTTELDSCRTQLLITIYHCPDAVAEILKIAHKYFYVLRGDWYLTSIFNRWLEENHIGKPEWFNYDEK